MGNRLRRLQKSLSRKQKTSSNRAKAKQYIALLHERISNQRSDFLHKLTHSLTCESQEVKTLCVENLNVKGMLKNGKLAKSISSVAWGEFFRQLKYKCLWTGKNLLKCGRFDPTSKTCSNCGWKNDGLKLSDRTWICGSCGAIHDRDINASKNIVDFAFDIYGEDTPNFKPVERKALAKTKVDVKLFSLNQEVAQR